VIFLFQIGTFIYIRAEKGETPGNKIMDVLLLHVPKFNNYYRPINRFSFVLFPPIGLLGLANYLQKNGYESRIIHLGVEQHKQGKIDLSNIIAEHIPSIIGLDLHWHFQSYDVINTARKIKQANPKIPVLLGGFTASLFAEEILRDFDCIDFVIRGDAEIPLLHLVRHYLSDRAYDQVPNLAYRQGNVVMVNPTSFIADSQLLDTICYTDFTLMKDYACFIESFSRYMNMPGLSEASQRMLFRWQKGYQVYLGRGCIHGCSYCGGSKEAHKIISGRNCVSMRSIDSILASIQDLEKFGFESACLALDSFPLPQVDDYYVAIFDRIKRLNISLDIEVERYYPPTIRFIKSFCELLGKGSFVTISPHTHNEQLRKRNALYRYSNQELEQSLSMMENEGVNTLLCFTCGLPFESMEDLKSMAKYQQYIRKKFKRVRFKTCMIEIEPGSGMSRNPQAYEIQLHRSSFADYYNYHSQPMQNHWLAMGYDRSGCPAHQQVSRFFCRHFCERFKAGWASPMVCSTTSAMWKLGVFRLFDSLVGLNPRPRKSILSTRK